jgi:hypothetical protein
MTWCAFPWARLVHDPHQSLWQPCSPSDRLPADIEDLMKKDKNGVVAICRCWRSKNFPLCDGSHTAFNKTCGDNVGPAVLKK